MSSCKDEAKTIIKNSYENSAAAKGEIFRPELVIAENFGFNGEIVSPKNYSPKQLEYKTTLPTKQLCLKVLRELVTAEKVARRQYDEAMNFSLFPELRQFEQEFLYIRNDEYEHELILGCIIKRLSTPAATIKPTAPVATKPKEAVMTTQTLRDIYLTVLDRFQEEEQKGVANYEDLLGKVNQSIDAATRTAADVEAVSMPLLSMQHKINRIIQEERNHLDTINAIKQMIIEM